MPGHGKDSVEAEFRARKPATHGDPTIKQMDASRPRSPPSMGYRRKLSVGSQEGRPGVPEFHAQTHPPGTAPPSKSYYPAPAWTPPSPTKAAFADPLSIPGATSQSVYNSSEYAYGKPLQGQTSRELRSHRGVRAGLEGVGASTKGETVEDKVRGQAGDIDLNVKGTKGKSGENRSGWPGAEDRVPEPVRSGQEVSEQEISTRK
ncbi:hypothetical protein RB595_008693 [Gaeumannomyces hyphopodioides]